MKSRLLLNIFMAAVLVGIILFINQSNKQETTNKLTSLSSKDITKIVIFRDSGNINFEKKDRQWIMTHPYKTPAHQFRIETILELLDSTPESIYDISNKDLKKYDLDSPRVTLQFNDKKIAFGNTNPINNNRYLKIDNSLALVKEKIYPLISSQPTSFVDLALLPGDNKISRLNLPGIELSKDETGKWMSQAEEQYSADDIQNLLQNWQSAKAFATHAYMQRKDLGQIEIKLQNDDTIIFHITDKKPWLILGRPDLDIEYHLDDSQIKQLLEPSSIESSNQDDA